MLHSCYVSAAILVATCFLCLTSADNTTDYFKAFVYTPQSDGWTLLTNEVNQTARILTTGRYVPFIKLVVHFDPVGGLSPAELYSFNRTMPQWLINHEFYSTVTINPVDDFKGLDDIGDRCPQGNCSSIKNCRWIYECLFNAGSGMDRFYPFWVRDFLGCLEKGNRWPKKTLQCAFKMADSRRTLWPLDRDVNCNTNKKWDLSPQEWKDADTDANLQTFIAGGPDYSGLWWPGWVKKGQAITEALGLQLLSNPTDWVCRLNNPCAFAIDCHSVGARKLQFGAFRDVAQTRWGYFVLRSIKNIHLQLTNHFQALQSAAIKVTLEAFGIDRFRPPDDKKTLTPLSVLNQLSIGFAVASGFTSSKFVEGTKELIAPLSLFFINRAQREPNTAAQQAQQDFALYLRSVYTLYEDTLQNVTAELFQGTQVNNGQFAFNISDMIKGGRWVSPTQLEEITVIEERIRVEVLSRSINALWREPANNTKNKMWVTYVNLQDDDKQSACLGHHSGPQNLKYCDDGGVYYGYNFVEEGDHLGKLGFPWGADKLGELGLNANWTVQASARTYRALRTRSTNPFNFTDVSALSHLIENPPNGTQLDAKQEYGRLPGTWTLPVCDISGYGEEWNVDYTQANSQPDLNLFYPGASSLQNLPHPPCLCGPGGSETADWVKAAGMLNFDTFYNRCRRTLLHGGFKWPENLNRINYGFNADIVKPGN